MGRTIASFAALAAATAFLAGTALGHAEFQSSTPSPGQVLTTSPATVTITFTEDLASGSTGFVTNASRDVVSTGSTISTTDRNTMTIALKANLANGGYTVFWHSVSADDGDVVDGSFGFTIARPAAAAPATPAATAPAARLPSTSSEGDQRSAWGLVLLGAAAVLGVSFSVSRKRGVKA